MVLRFKCCPTLGLKPWICIWKLPLLSLLISVLLFSLLTFFRSEANRWLKRAKIELVVNRSIIRGIARSICSIFALIFDFLVCRRLRSVYIWLSLDWTKLARCSVTWLIVVAADCCNFCNSSGIKRILTCALFSVKNPRLLEDISEYLRLIISKS